MSLRDLQNLEGRVALITGGSRGLGLQMAEVLGELGATVVITARKEAELEEAAVTLKSQSIKVEAMVNDFKIPILFSPWWRIFWRATVKLTLSSIMLEPHGVRKQRIIL